MNERGRPPPLQRPVPRANEPVQPVTRAPELSIVETIEYKTTVALDAPPHVLDPIPPPGIGWRLVTATYFNGKMYRDWARKVIANA